MENLMKLFHDWEIQLLILLSFTIQIFLFFTGGLRRRGTNPLIRLSIWIAYLGADTVAVYALGYLSRQEGDAHILAFFWAPFLLVHLGGQDTITAFSLEDNNLWLRHILNLVVQVVLTVYIFWKSIGRHSVALLVSGAFVFVVGVIKYGERIWSLRCAQFESLEDSSGYQYETPCLAEEERRDDHDAGDYCNTVLGAMFAMQDVFFVFASRSSMIEGIRGPHVRSSGEMRKSLEIVLGLMYDDLYTKALGLRTLRGIALRCTSQVCALVAFIVFVVCDRRRYSRVDTAITYSLFMGCLSLEVCSLVRLMASPWTWIWTRAWQKVLKLRIKLDGFSWFLLSSDLTGWSQRRPLWSNAMGQYNYYSWLMTGRDITKQDKQPSYSFSQQCMTMVRRLATLLGLEKEKIFFISKLLDREHVKVNGLLECLLDGVDRFILEYGNPIKLPDAYISLLLGALLNRGFGFAILHMHLLTEQLLAQDLDVEANLAAADTTSINLLMEECRKLSRYMMYLMVACPSLLPLEVSSAALLDDKQHDKQDLDLLQSGSLFRLDKETLEEIKEVWIRLIIYAASKTRPEQHAAQLARGGELLTFVWMQLLINLRCEPIRIELTNRLIMYEVAYALHLP